jgi:tetratricopeptide (TPR) repeat protein
MVRSIATVVLLVVACSSGVMEELYAQEPSPRQIWPEATAAAREGDFQAAEKHTATLLAAGKTYGIRTYPSYAEAAAALAREFEQTNREYAQWGRVTTNQLDGRSAAVVFAEADRAARSGDTGSALRLVFAGFARAAGNYRSATLARADLIIVASLAVALTAVVFALALFFRYQRSAAHDFRELLGNLLVGGSVTVIAFALLFLPLFFWLGPLWLAFYWFIIFFGYSGTAERVAIVVLLVLLAVLPVVIDAAAHRIASVESPVLAAALASAAQSYRPEALPRIEELVAIAPDHPTLHLLTGNMLAFDGRDDQAAAHYRRAIELRPQYAGAHVNLGNLLFLNNDFQAAMTEYRRAQQADPQLAAAYYNHSVVSGETYRFAQQAQMLDSARKADPSLLDWLRRNPAPQKVVMYNPPLSEAWGVANTLSRLGSARNLFGNYSTFDPKTAILTPITMGALASLLLAIAIWNKRRSSGFANACIKCGRTFCYRCKSARESATYCTQCIHIYLKRDGVSIETKRQKLEEVTDYYTGMTRRNRLFALFLPGAAQMLEGRTLSGIAGMIVFTFMVGVALFVGRLAPALGPLAEFAQLLLRSTAILLAFVTWLAMLVPIYRRRSAA